jgi:hypothetical protein
MSVLAKAVNTNISQYEAGSRFIILRDYWLGLYYRFGYFSQAYITTLGFNYNQFAFSYAFDFESASSFTHQYTSHELMINYVIGVKRKRFKL